MKGGENMLNLSMKPTVITPSFQTAEDFSPSKTNNSQPVAKQSSFSKTLTNAVNSKRNHQQNVSVPLNEERVSQKETSLEQRQTVTQEPKRMDQNEKPAATAKESESQPTQTESKPTTKAEKTQPVKSDDSKEKVTDPQSNQATDTVDNTTAVALVTPMAIDLQPLSVQTPVTVVNSDPAVNSNENGLTVNSGLTAIPTVATTDPKQATDDTHAKVALSQQNSPQDTVNAQSILPSAVIAEQVSSSVMPNEAIAQSSSAVVGVAQSVENFSNQKVIHSTSQTQKTQQVTTPSQAKTNDSDGIKFSDVMNGKTAEVQATIAEVKAGDSVVKPGELQATIAEVKTGDSEVKPSDGQKDLMGPNLLVAADSKDNHQSIANGKVPFLVAATAATQVTGHVGKPQTVNLPLIQTQLSVNSSTDKVRSDIGLVATNNQQPTTTEANSDVKASTTNHINRDDLFAQIVEKAKVLVNNGHSEMEISLKPEHLGKLQLKISVVDQVVTAKFMAESQQVKEVIETHLNQLRRNLQDTGVQVDQLMVSVGQNNNGSSFQQSSHFQDEPAGNILATSANQENSRESLSDTPSEKSSLRDTVIDYVA
jgi:flagellar hook-length control protein FliK